MGIYHNLILVALGGGGTAFPGSLSLFSLFKELFGKSVEEIAEMVRRMV